MDQYAIPVQLDSQHLEQVLLPVTPAQQDFSDLCAPRAPLVSRRHSAIRAALALDFAFVLKTVVVFGAKPAPQAISLRAFAMCTAHRMKRAQDMVTVPVEAIAFARLDSKAARAPIAQWLRDPLLCRSSVLVGRQS
eukprot:ANDGO_04660.mRNA.1 hypothetical protein